MTHYSPHTPGSLSSICLCHNEPSACSVLLSPYFCLPSQFKCPLHEALRATSFPFELPVLQLPLAKIIRNHLVCNSLPFSLRAEPPFFLSPNHRVPWDGVSEPLLTSWLTLSRSLKVLEPPFPLLLNRDKRTCCTDLSELYGNQRQRHGNSEEGRRHLHAYKGLIVVKTESESLHKRLPRRTITRCMAGLRVLLPYNCIYSLIVTCYSLTWGKEMSLFKKDSSVWSIALASRISNEMPSRPLYPAPATGRGVSSKQSLLKRGGRRRTGATPQLHKEAALQGQRSLLSTKPHLGRVPPS